LADSNEICCSVSRIDLPLSNVNVVHLALRMSMCWLVRNKKCDVFMDHCVVIMMMLMMLA